MRNRSLASLIFMVALSVSGAGPAVAQVTGADQDWLRPQLSVDYTWVHSNAPPGACGCFDLNGGGASLAWPVKSWHFAPTFEGNFINSSGVNANGNTYDLTLAVYTFGGRYFVPVQGRWRPFGEALIGFAHATGSLVEHPNPGAGNAGLAFAATLGGGIDLRASQRIAIRMIQADYLATTFDNNVGGNQNNLRLSAGLVLRF